MIDFNHIKGFDVICDTNIFIDLTQDHFRDALINFLVTAQKNKNTFHYCNYSIFELFRGQPKKLVDDYKKVLDLFKGVPLDNDILEGAGQLMSLYKHLNIVSTASTNKIKNPEKIDDGDYIIASTAILHKNTAILTRNYLDFPRPFFNEIYKHYLEYESNGKKGLETYYLLEPDLPYANKLYKMLS